MKKLLLITFLLWGSVQAQQPPSTQIFDEEYCDKYFKIIDLRDTTKIIADSIDFENGEFEITAFADSGEFDVIDVPSMVNISPYIFSSSKTITLTLPERVSIVTVELLLEYEQECYSDSSLFIQQKHPGFSHISIDSIKFINPILVRETWIHEEPTFKGFLYWLKEKYK